MASAAHQAFPAVIDPNMVGNAFVIQYYHILYNKPEFLHQFYQNFSRIGRPGPDENMLVISTLPAIHENLLTLACGDHRAAEITTVDSQESYNGGVLVVVTGYYPFSENSKRKFIQTFFLAPQENGYFVLNDIFRLVDEPKTNDGDIVAGSTSGTPIPPPLVPTKDNDVSEEPASTWVNPGDEEANKPLDEGNAPTMEEKDPVPEIINEVPELEITSKEATDDLQKVSEPENGPQDAPKISYASVVSGQTVMKEKSGVLAAPSLPPKPASEAQDQQVASTPQVVKSHSVPVAMDAVENVDNQDFEVAAEGASIYVKGLPPNATLALLENEFKQFGTIRSGGIQVKRQRGFAFGFVEFKDAVAAQRAIEASPVIVGGRKTIVEEKRSTSRGDRERPSSGPGNGYRSEGVRGRGGYGGGKGYSRGEYGNRVYNNRGGGYSSRRGNGYPRTEGDGRMNHSDYISVNNTSKTLESDIPASA